MTFKESVKRGGLAVLGLALLGALWGRVRAAQGLSRPEQAPQSVGRMKSFYNGMALAAVSGAATSVGYGAGGSAGLEDKRDAFFPASMPIINAARTPVPQQTPRKIVRNASVGVEVRDYGQARRLALEAAARLGSEVERDEAYENGGCKSGVLAFRASPDKLDALVKDVETLGRVLHRSVSMQNLTEEYVDLQARVANMRKVDKRLTELLAFQTRRLSDVLQVEKEIERVGGDIERIEGRMKYIDSLAAQSVLTLSLSEPSRETSRATGVLNRIANSLTRACNTFVTTGLVLLDLAGFLLAVGLWTAPFGGLIWLALRKRTAKDARES